MATAFSCSLSPFYPHSMYFSLFHTFSAPIRPLPSFFSRINTATSTHKHARTHPHTQRTHQGVRYDSLTPSPLGRVVLTGATLLDDDTAYQWSLACEPAQQRCVCARMCAGAGVCVARQGRWVAGVGMCVSVCERLRLCLSFAVGVPECRCG